MTPPAPDGAVLGPANSTMDNTLPVLIDGQAIFGFAGLAQNTASLYTSCSRNSEALYRR